MTRVGIISMAHHHALSYAQALKQLPGVTLVGIADERAERREEAAIRFGTQAFADTETLLAVGLDAVIVTSENARHHRDVLQAAAAGVHVLCEKPLSTNAEDGREMIEACKRAGVLLQTAFPVRFCPPIRRMKALVEQGEIGRLLAAKTTNRGTNPGGWFADYALSGGGAMLDHTVHVVDILRWISGTEVREVYAESATSRFTDVPIDDCGTLTLTFDDGMFATLDFSWSRNRAYPTWGDVTIELIGSEGTLFVDAFAQNIHVFSNSQGYRWDHWGSDMDSGLIEDFIGAVRSGRAPSITGEDGLRAAEVAFAAYESSCARKPVAMTLR